MKHVFARAVAQFFLSPAPSSAQIEPVDFFSIGARLIERAATSNYLWLRDTQQLAAEQQLCADEVRASLNKLVHSPFRGPVL